MMNNTVKTITLLGALSGILIALGGLIADIPGIIIALIIACIINGVTYFFCDTLALRLYKAKPLDKKEYPEIYSMVQELTNLAGLPMPRLWLINSPMANAFATGRSPDKASIAVTSGILSLLNKEELRGVLAHEVSHIKNRDMLVTTMAVILASAIGSIAYAIRRSAFQQRSGKKSAMAAIGLLLIGILMPIIALIIQLAISRSREYQADESGAALAQDPLALASALEKLHMHVMREPMDAQDTPHAATAPLFIVHPLCGRGWSKLFATHPPIAQRVHRLHEMHRKSF